MLGRIKNKVSPVETPTEPTEGDKKLKELKEGLEKGEFDEILNVDSSALTREIEEQKKQQKQQEQLKESVEKEKVELEELTSISGKMDHIATSSLDRIKMQVDSYGIGVDGQLFSKQVQDLETKLKPLNEKIETIKGEIEKKEQAQSEMSEQKKIIDSLIDYNKLVSLYNKMKEEYDSLVPYIVYSKNLLPLFNKERDGIVKIEGITEEKLPDNDTERKKLHEEMKKKKLPSIDKKTKEITDKFTKLKLLIDKFDAYRNAENVLLSSYKKNNELKLDADEYKKKKAYIEQVKDDLKETLDLDRLKEYDGVLPLVAAFMGNLTTIDPKFDGVNKAIEENTQKFNKAKSELHGLKFVKKYEKGFKKNHEYDGDVIGDLGNTFELKEEINDFLKDSVTRLIFTSFINGIENSNIKDYRKEKNGKYYLIAYIYTLVYELGNDTFPLDFHLSDVDGITHDDKKKINGIGALTIEGINSLDVNNLQIDIPTDPVFYGLDLLEHKHVAFLENYKDKTVINGLLMNIFNGIVKGAIDDDDGYEELDNLSNTIKPFYEKIIKTTEEREAEEAKREAERKAKREAEEAEQAKIGFTVDEFNYYLDKRPYEYGDDLFIKMEDFKTNYTGEFSGGQEATLKELTEEINVQALSQFIEKYNDKKRSINEPLPKKPGDPNYITLEDYKAFINYLERKIPLPDSQIPIFITTSHSIKAAGPHAIVLNEILDNLPDILMLRDADMLNNFRSWFFKENSVREGLHGTNEFENTEWYKNHIAYLENFLEDIIRKRIEELDNQADSQGSRQSRTDLGKRYTLPFIDPTKFQSPKIMEDCPAIAFLKKLLGDHFSKIVVDGSWKGKNGVIGREEWEKEWEKGKGTIPESETTRTGEEICTILKKYISEDSTYTEKLNEGKVSLKKAIVLIFSPDKLKNTNTGEACIAVSQELWKIITDADINKCESPVAGGSQKRRKDTRRKRKDTRRKRKDTRKKLRKDTRRKRKDTRRKRKDTRRKIRKDTRRKIRKDTRRKTRK